MSKAKPRQPEAHARRFDSLVIVSHGRSGSKLLQGLLNTAPGFLIRGENLGFIEGFEWAFDKLHTARNNPIARGSDSPTNAFYGVHEFDDAEFLAGVASVVRNTLVPPEMRRSVVCYGFKEIRFPLKSPAFGEYMVFLRSIMPKLAIVVNTRSHENIAESGWWPDRPRKKVVKILAASDAVRLDYVAANLDHAFHIEYEDICVRGPQLAALFDFVGAAFQEEKIAATLGVQHGSGNVIQRQPAVAEAEDGGDIAAPPRKWAMERRAEWEAEDD